MPAGERWMGRLHNVDLSKLLRDKSRNLGTLGHSLWPIPIFLCPMSSQCSKKAKNWARICSRGSVFKTS